jgi:DNA-binding transcriptional ArsR family regulator
MAQSDLRAGVTRLVYELMTGGSTHVELVESSDMADSTVRLWLQALRAGHVVRICGWERYGNGGWKPVFELNPEGLPDAPRPPKLTAAQRQANWRDRKRNQRLHGVTRPSRG